MLEKVVGRREKATIKYSWAGMKGRLQTITQFLF